MKDITNWDELITEDATKWPVASTTGATEPNPDKFVRRYNVPVLQTHKRVIGGNDVVFDVDKLRAICAYCNKRIQDTGDYAGICVGHTRKGQDPPPLIGFAGPFKMGWLNEDKTTPAILADFRIYADKEPLLEQYPRRSPELMYDASYENIYLDPIALLGGETPWADLGTCYAAGDCRKTDAVKYEACAAQVPGGYGNPFETKGRKRVDYQAGAGSDGVSLSPELKEVVRQLQEAVFESPELKWIRSQMQQKADALDVEEANDDPSPPIDDAAQESATEEQDDENASRNDGGEDGIDYAALFGDGSEDEESDRKVKPDSLDESTDDSNPSNSRGLENEDENDDFLSLKYESDDLTPVDEAFDGGEESSDNDEEGEEEMATNERILDALDKINARLDRLELANARLNGQVVDKARYNALDELRTRRVFDLEEEKKVCKYNKMSDAEFAKRLERIEEVYAETNARPFDPTRIGFPDRVVQDAPTADPVRYQADRARQIAERVARRASLNAQAGTWQSAEEIEREVVKELGL